MAGDALEMATVKRPLSGVHVVIQSLGVSAGPEVILKPTRFFSTATRVLVTAMEETQVKRLISVTGFGAGDSRGRGGFLYNAAFHLLLGRVYDDKDVQEWIVRRSRLDWVIVRPVILTEGPKSCQPGKRSFARCASGSALSTAERQQVHCHEDNG